MHAANLSKSARLKAMHYALKRAGRKGATTWELIHMAASANVSSVISELRRNEIEIDCDRESLPDGRQVYRYTLTEFKQ